ncbi:MAG: CpsD/CapB family tyrosine-protein kinase [Silicimonas sp.]|jgi:Mrp family chromosome partitioning ATPase|nr:CpsD/CapB family tyrosine-protein kinase [Silicimonas sp.]
MEKLQAALARAREKRDNDGRPVRTPGNVSRGGARKVAREEKVSERWAALEPFTPVPAIIQKSRIYASEATVEAQHFDILRTKLLLEMRRNNWTRIAVTSATAGCGKTTTVCNVIAGLGRQPEIRGMLFDLDLRRPSVASLFGATPKKSLDAVLLGEAEFSENALRLHENTCIALTTRAIADPAKLILSNQTSEFFDQVQADYEPNLMLFDTPPVLVSDETRGFLKHVDAVLIVAGAGMSTVAQIDEVEREVAQYTNVAGIVLNKCRYLERGYGDYY